MNKAAKVLEEKGLSQKDNGAVIIDLTKHNKKLGKAIIQKKDGTTLYLTRDIGAAMERWDHYKFDKMIYVVAATQNLHFKQLFKILELMGHEWAKNCSHVNYGIVSLPDGAMSTRKGNVLLLEDVVTAAQESMHEKMQEDAKGKLDEIINERGEDPRNLSDLIGLSACVISDLSAKRIKDYVFVMDRATSHVGFTGPYLQYSHARLCSMKDHNSEVKLTCDVDAKLLDGVSSYEVIHQLSLFPTILESCEKTLEPCTIVGYLFDLCSSINTANKALYIKNQEPPTQEARLLLFDCSRIVLQSGLQILGLPALERM